MQDLLEGIKNFNKRNLKDVPTVEKNTYVVEEGKGEGKGHFSWKFGHEDEEDLIEWFDDTDKFRENCKILADMIRNSNHVVVYTGAGISTSAKLPDYRGSDGMWTNRDRGTNMDMDKYTTISHAIPTLAHMSLAELMKRNIVKYIVSTNVDGLHMRSGIPKDKLSELHGNSYVEVCEKCKKRYLRESDVLKNQTPDHRVVNRHWCGATCEVEGCGGLLLDTIVAFGENLPTDELESGYEESRKGDLAIVLGSTMRVQPACLLPEEIFKRRRKPGYLVICNLQRTPYDKYASLKIQGYIDDIFYLVMQELGIEIPMVTPEGFDVPPYIDRIDLRYKEKSIESKEKYQSLMKRREENPDDGKDNENYLTRGDNPYQRNVIKGKNDTTDIVLEKIELMFFNDCDSSNYNVNCKTKKIVIENCKDTTITINEKIITCVVELINSTNMTLNINAPVYTLTCDNLENIKVNFSKKDYFQLMARAKVNGIELVVEGETIDMTISEDIDQSQSQLITQKDDSGNIATKITQRDRSGRITTLV